MTTGDNPFPPDPRFQPPPPSGGYPPPPPPPGGYPPPPPAGYSPPPGYGPASYGPANYGPANYGPPGYPDPAFGQPSGYPPPPPPFGAQPGTLGARFLARVIDGLLVGITAFLLALIFGVESNILVTGLFSGVLMFIYFVALEVTQGTTLGKKLLGLYVNGPGGAAKPDLQQSAIRNSFTLLPVIPYIGGLLAFVAYVVIGVTINGSPTKQGKHDELAGGTQVVKR
jgi:uncharacterized RDD family membrane protein YckC